MSYILDALRKAERERAIAQVPTLMTVHETRIDDRSQSPVADLRDLPSMYCAIVWSAASLFSITAVFRPIPSGNAVAARGHRKRSLDPLRFRPLPVPSSVDGYACGSQIPFHASGDLKQ